MIDILWFYINRSISHTKMPEIAQTRDWSWKKPNHKEAFVALPSKKVNTHTYTHLREHRLSLVLNITKPVYFLTTVFYSETILSH